MPRLHFDTTKALGFSSPLEVPTYGIAEAAHYLRMPYGTLRDWLLGCKYSVKHGTEYRRSLPLIDIADESSRLLSFTNLAEAHVLGAFRRKHGVPLDNIRAALQYVKDQYGWSRPLLEQEFATDGARMFVEHLGTMVDTKGGQIVMQSLIASHLKRLERNEHGVFRLYPFTRPNRAEDNPRSVFIDPVVAFGRPVLAKARIPTASLVERYLAGETIEHLARDYDCETLDIQEAIRCEWVDIAA